MILSVLTPVESQNHIKVTDLGMIQAAFFYTTSEDQRCIQEYEDLDNMDADRERLVL